VDGSHIRTLLLTFFYRQMPQLIDSGYVYIAQPPLFRAKRGKGETYIKDEKDLQAWLIHRAAESRVVRLRDGKLEISGEQLEKLLHKLMAFRKYLQVLERKGHPRDVIEKLLDREADKGFFGDQAALRRVAEELTGPLRSVSIHRDEEHNLFCLVIEDRSNGYARP
jgi:DNA gyrase subunit B